MLGPTLELLNLFGNPLSDYKEVAQKALPALNVLDNRNISGSDHHSQVEASLTKYLRGSTTCNSLVEDSARQRKYLLAERGSGSPGKLEEMDPAVVKKLMQEIHSLKCENSMMQEQLRSSQVKQEDSTRKLPLSSPDTTCAMRGTLSNTRLPEESEEKSRVHEKKKMGSGHFD